MNDAARFLVELEFGGLVGVVEASRAGGGPPLLLADDGRRVYEVSEGVYLLGEAGEFAYRVDL